MLGADARGPEMWRGLLPSLTGGLDSALTLTEHVVSTFPPHMSSKHRVLGHTDGEADPA